MLKKPEMATKNRHFRDISNIGNVTQNEDKAKNTTQKTKQMNNTNPTKQPAWTHVTPQNNQGEPMWHQG